MNRVKGISLTKIVFLLALSFIGFMNLGCPQGSNKPAEQAQGQQILNPQQICSYAGTQSGQSISLKDAESSAIQTIQSIINTAGLPMNFTLHAGEVESACAIVNGDKRMIIYNPFFMKGARGGRNGTWVETAIFAHMIAHHLSGHDLKVEAGRELSELEADKFAGLTLQKMGATLEQSTEALYAISSELAQSHYPEVSSRISALESGWNQARGFSQNNVQYSSRTYDADRMPTRTSSLSNGEIAGFLTRWSQSQSNYDFADYADCYSYGFQGIKMNKRGRTVYYDYGGWLNDRQKMYSRAMNLNVSTSNIRVISRDDWGTTVQFTQYYYRDSYQDTGDKLMKLRKDNDGSIRIVYEEMLSSY